MTESRGVSELTTETSAVPIVARDFGGGGVPLLLETVRDNPWLRVVRLDGASHAMVAERPRQLAELVTDFLAAPRSAHSGTRR